MRASKILLLPAVLIAVAAGLAVWSGGGGGGMLSAVAPDDGDDKGYEEVGLAEFHPGQPLKEPLGSINQVTFTGEESSGAQVTYTDDGPGKKPALKFGKPAMPHPHGDTYWRNFYVKYGDLSETEYRRHAAVQRKFLHELSSTYADEMLVRGEYYPWRDDAVLETDADLRERLGGLDSELSMGGFHPDTGNYYVVFEKEAQWDIYEAYWEYAWLESAAKGAPLHKVPN